MQRFFSGTFLKYGQTTPEHFFSFSETDSRPTFSRENSEISTTPFDSMIEYIDSELCSITNDEIGEKHELSPRKNFFKFKEHQTENIESIPFRSEEKIVRQGLKSLNGTSNIKGNIRKMGFEESPKHRGIELFFNTLEDRNVECKDGVLKRISDQGLTQQKPNNGKHNYQLVSRV